MEETKSVCRVCKWTVPVSKTAHQYFTASHHAVLGKMRVFEETIAEDIPLQEMKALIARRPQFYGFLAPIITAMEQAGCATYAALRRA